MEGGYADILQRDRCKKGRHKTRSIKRDVGIHKIHVTESVTLDLFLPQGGAMTL